MLFLVAMRYLLLLALMSLAIPARAEVMEKSKSFVAQLLELGKLSRASKGVVTAESKKAIQNISAQIDFEALASKSLGNTWKNLAAPKRKEFMNTLKESIEVLLFPKADRITAPLNEVKFSVNPKASRQVRARTKFETLKQGEVIEKEIEFELVFDAREKVVDTFLEGELVSANLKRQFDQALQKKTFDQLLAQMKTRLANAKKPKVAASSGPTPAPAARLPQKAGL